MNRLLRPLFPCLLLASTAAQATYITTPPTTWQPVSDSVLQTVAQSLPESVNVNAGFLNTDYDPWLTVNETANVFLTFLDEGAGYKNSLGWMSFVDGTFEGLNKGNIDIDGSGTVSLNELATVQGLETGWLFANASRSGGGGNLVAGDTVTVGNGPLAAGTSVSFFLAQNAWRGGQQVADGVMTGDTQIFYGLDFLNPEADFTSTIDSNLADARHVAMLFADESEQQVIMGFEDLNRENRFANDWNIRSDNDFNDAIFTLSADPVTALNKSNIATAPLPALDEGATGCLLLLGMGYLLLFRNKTRRI